MTISYTESTRLEKKRAFATLLEKELPSTERIGSMVGTSMHYFMPNHKIYNLTGITSPDFFKYKFDIQPFSIIDQLKHHPQLRFEDWIAYSDFEDSFLWVKPFIGKSIFLDNDSELTGSPALKVYKAKWATLDGGNTPKLINTSCNTLIDQVDVGYYDDEISHSYHSYTRLKNTIFPLCILTEKLGTNDYSEVGRIVLGSESFIIHNISLEKPMKIILRTAKSINTMRYFGSKRVRITNFELNDTLVLRLFIDDQEVFCTPVSLKQKGFSEVIFEVPIKYLKNDTSRIKILGDHISFAYWFYQ
jgi:hypothetical protein